MEKNEVFQLRLTPGEKAAWVAAAEMAGMSLSELVRKAVIRFIASLDEEGKS